MIVYPTNRVRLVTHRGGSLHGISMIEIRLQGCDVQCETCSAPETWVVDPRKHAENLEDAMKCRGSWTDLICTEIMTEIEELQEQSDARIRWVKITGGEPTMYDLGQLLLDLREAGYRIALETAGYNISALLYHVDRLIVSPLLEGQFASLGSVLRAADELRFVVSTNREMTLIDELLGMHPSNAETILIPLRSKSKTEMQRARQICEHEARWRKWRVL
jgi:organic radical activating enzyme